VVSAILVATVASGWLVFNQHPEHSEGSLRVLRSWSDSELSKEYRLDSHCKNDRNYGIEQAIDRSNTQDGDTITDLRLAHTSRQVRVFASTGSYRHG
jgi:hypothetical protein